MGSRIVNKKSCRNQVFPLVLKSTPSTYHLSWKEVAENKTRQTHFDHKHHKPNTHTFITKFKTHPQKLTRERPNLQPQSTQNATKKRKLITQRRGKNEGKYINRRRQKGVRTEKEEQSIVIGKRVPEKKDKKRESKLGCGEVVEI